MPVCVPPGLEPHCSSPSHGPPPYFTPIQSSDRKEKVDTLELLTQAKIDLKPLPSQQHRASQGQQDSSRLITAGGRGYPLWVWSLLGAGATPSGFDLCWGRGLPPLGLVFGPSPFFNH